MGSGGLSIRPTKNILLFLLSSFLLSSCTTSTPPLSTPQLVPVYSSFAAEPWLSELYDCAVGQGSVILSRVDDPNSAEVALRIGEPEFLSSFAYQIDEEEILVVTHRQSPVQNLTLDEARALFMGLGDANAPVQVWVYASEEDIQQAFDHFVMEGRSVTSSATIAATPQQMSDTLVSEPNTVGILPRHGKAGDSRELLSVATVPVLALTPNEPQAVIKELIACLQK
ncbi:MAG TPA: hypothetical protein VFR47_17525 [Anaerolineales bacterium]|nr:hypothetical protein [Anaerolineales bacterium]